MDNSFGRPEDKDIEKEFMRKIRGDKLQAINAQCELEICLAFRDGTEQPKKNNRKKNSQSQNDDDKITDNQLLVMEINGLNDERQELI